MVMNFRACVILKKSPKNFFDCDSTQRHQRRELPPPRFSSYSNTLMLTHALKSFLQLRCIRRLGRGNSFSFHADHRLHAAVALSHNAFNAQPHPTTATMTLNTPFNPLETRILPVNASEIGAVSSHTIPWIEDWSLELSESSSAQNLQEAARQLLETDIPVGFPTETVYGLGADAKKDEAVKAIFRVKGRPSDNPLIVHFASIRQIRRFLQSENDVDSIPEIYKPLIERFWPGPLTILLPLPSPSPLAPSVTVGLKTFGARIPRNPVALALLRLANVPIAAPISHCCRTCGTRSRRAHIACVRWRAVRYWSGEHSG